MRRVLFGEVVMWESDGWFWILRLGLNKLRKYAFLRDGYSGFMILADESISSVIVRVYRES